MTLHTPPPSFLPLHNISLLLQQHFLSYNPSLPYQPLTQSIIQGTSSNQSRLSSSPFIPSLSIQNSTRSIPPRTPLPAVPEPPQIPSHLLTPSQQSCLLSRSESTASAASVASSSETPSSTLTSISSPSTTPSLNPTTLYVDLTPLSDAQVSYFMLIYYSRRHTC